MIISPSRVRLACQELRSQGQVPCFVATAPHNYHESRIEYGLTDNDILQIAGLLVLPTESAISLESAASFLLYSVDSELTDTEIMAAGDI